MCYSLGFFSSTIPALRICNLLPYNVLELIPIHINMRCVAIVRQVNGSLLTLTMWTWFKFLTILTKNFRSKVVMYLLRTLVLQGLFIKFKAKHSSGIHNFKVEYLSWLQWDRHRISFPQADAHSSPIPLQFLHMIDFKCYALSTPTNSTSVNAFEVLGHLSWKLKWAFLIAFRPSFVCLSVCPSVNFSYFRLLLQNYWANFNET